MNREQLDEIRTRAEAATKGPWEADDWEIYGPTRATWIAETCDADDWDKSRANGKFVAAARTDVPALLDEIDRLRKLLAHDLAPEEWEAHAYKLGADYEWSAPAVGTFVGWLAYRHETERANNKILRSVIERRTTAEGPAEGGTQKGSSEVSRCPNCAPGYDCESGNYGGGPTGGESR